MQHARTSLVILTVVITILVIIAIVVVAGLVVIYSGMLNVAATSPHGAITTWVLSTTADRSVEAAARHVQVPPDFDRMDIRAAYFHYDGMCMMCHGAPGVDAQWVGKGLYPKPPDLRIGVEDLSPAEVFWIIKHGLKDTGMPALAPTHPDGEIWKITAFVKKLPEMTPEAYKALGQGSAGAPAAPGTSPESGGRLPQGGNQAGAANQRNPMP